MNKPLERYFMRKYMDTKTKEAFEKFENTVDVAMNKLSEIITYNELVEYFEDEKIIDLW